MTILDKIDAVVEDRSEERTDPVIITIRIGARESFDVFVSPDSGLNLPIGSKLTLIFLEKLPSIPEIDGKFSCDSVLGMCSEEEALNKANGID